MNNIPDIKWHKRFLTLAEHIALWSKDPSTQVGAIIINNHYERKPISFGYNGIPRGVRDNSERYELKNIKYLYTEHAERNAIYNAQVNLLGTIIYCTHFPCADCTRAIIQTGIKEIIVWDTALKTHWEQNIEVSKTMLTEAIIQLTVIPQHTASYYE